MDFGNLSFLFLISYISIKVAVGNFTFIGVNRIISKNCDWKGKTDEGQQRDGAKSDSKICGVTVDFSICTEYACV